MSANQPITAARAALAIWTIWSIRFSARLHCHAIKAAGRISSAETAAHMPSGKSDLATPKAAANGTACAISASIAQ